MPSHYQIHCVSRSDRLNHDRRIRNIGGVNADGARWQISEAVAIPTIGIGASVACDGQILVLEDMLGLSPRVPKFVKRYGDLGPGIEAAIAAYAKDVRGRAFPGPEQVYEMRPKAPKAPKIIVKG